MVLSGVPRKKSPVTLGGIDLGTVRLVAQCLNYYATPGPGLELYLYFIFNLGARRKCVVHVTLRPLYPLGKRHGPHCKDGWVGSRDVEDGAKDLVPIGIRSSDCPFRSD